MGALAVGFIEFPNIMCGFVFEGYHVYHVFLGAKGGGEVVDYQFYLLTRLIQIHVHGNFYLL